MHSQQTDIIIHGAGIAGLWTLNLLKNLGYDALLVEPRGIGGIQTIASQGIIHSGLKYALEGKINPLARGISSMPEIWRAALRGEGPIDLSRARIAAPSQHMLIPKGIVGNLVKIGAKSFFGREIPVPGDIMRAGFTGSAVEMGEPVLDIPSLIRALAEPHKNSIRKSAEGIRAKRHIYTAAAGNDQAQIPTQRRPLLMGMIKNAPFPLWAHLVGASDKPVATITTHRTTSNDLIWYCGGQVAERAKESNPSETRDAMLDAIGKYMPGIQTDHIEWAVLPIDRVEAKPVQGVMPDTPALHQRGDALYAWPTKLTFAPALGDKIVEALAHDNISPSHNSSDWSFLPEVPYAEPPWETTQWTKDQSAKRA